VGLHAGKMHFLYVVVASVCLKGVHGVR